MVLDGKILSVVLLLFAGVLTIYVSLLATTASVAQEEGDPTNIDEPTDLTGPDGIIDQYDDLTDAENDLLGGEETLPLSVDQEIEEDAESGDAIPEASVYNTGDGSAVCAPVQQTPVTGNQQSGQENVGIGSEGDVLFGSPDLSVAPDQYSACAQTVQPTS
jgi:hypothetical protein